MNIKSNRKKQGPSFFKSAWRGFKELLPDMNGGIKFLIFMVGVVVAFLVWDYSAMASIFSIAVGGILIVQDDFNDIGPGTRVVFTLLAALAVFMLGSPNVYHTDEKKYQVEYSKLTFTDSTEKIIIFMTYPEKKTVNQPLSTTQYYTLKEQKNDLNMTITESGEYDHWSMLSARESKDKLKDIEEYTYSFTIKTPSDTIENKYWLKTKTRQFIPKEKK